MTDQTIQIEEFQKKINTLISDKISALNEIKEDTINLESDSDCEGEQQFTKKEQIDKKYDDLINKLAMEFCSSVLIKQDVAKPDYNRMTMKELKSILKERGLKVSGKKDELISRLNDNDEKKSLAPEDDLSDEGMTEEELKKKSNKDLKKMCKSMGKKGYSSLKKHELIKMILESSEEQKTSE